MIVKTLIVTPFQQNARLLIDPKTNKAVVIDPGGDVDRIYEQVELEGVELEAIWLTHSHIDHVAGVKAFKEKVGEAVPLFGSSIEKDFRGRISEQAAFFALPV